MTRLAPKETLKPILVNMRKSSGKIRCKSNMSPLMNVIHHINRLKEESIMNNKKTQKRTKKTQKTKKKKKERKPYENNYSQF